MSEWAGRRLVLVVSFVLSLVLAGCGSGGGGGSVMPTVGAPVAGTTAVTPLDSAATNLVFVVTPDLAHNGGDINPATANLTNQGLQRALRLGTYLHTTLLRSANASGIYSLIPATHLQTANNYPDMVPLEVIEQFAMLNQYTENLFLPPPAQLLGAPSFPINISYTASSRPEGVSVPPAYLTSCQGIDFADRDGGNEALVNRIVAERQAGYHVFALPFETFQSLLVNLRTRNGWTYDVPASWQGSNTVYALTVPIAQGAVPPQSQPVLSSYDAGIVPGTAYPTLVPPFTPGLVQQTPFQIETAALAGATPPVGINTNSTVYFVRHGEAHPSLTWENGNLVMPGNWRALYLPTALAGKIKTPDYVYAVDPAQGTIGMPPAGSPKVELTPYSYVRTSQTVAPYAIANGIPFCLPLTFQYEGLTKATNQQAVENTVRYFFTEGRFSNKTLLVGWEHAHIPEIGQTLVGMYYSNPASAPAVGDWPATDYDTVWSFTLDANGHLTLDNHIAEGIDSASLPSTAPSF